MENKKRIDWNPNEDALLNISVKKSRKKNWNKIFYNLQNRNINQLKARWMKWKHNKVKKKIWSLLEDSKLLFQSNFVQNFSFIKICVYKRTHWQCFFRKIILFEIKFFKKLEKKEKNNSKISIPILLKHKFQSRSRFEFYLKTIYKTQVKMIFFRKSKIKGFLSYQLRSNFSLQKIMNFK
jgi:hypothetical protein